MKQCKKCNDIDDTDTLYSSDANVLKADAILKKIQALQDLEALHKPTRAELKKMSSLVKSLHKVLSKKVKR